MRSRIKAQSCGTSVSVLALAMAWGAYSTPALAQQGQQEIETVTVTATGTNIAGIAPVGSESIKLDRDAIEATGFTTATEVVNTLPQVQQVQNVGRLGGTSMYGGYGGYGANSSQGTSFSLRALGQLATLVLVDGRRVAPSGAAQTFTQGNLLPIAAIQSIEVVADGSSGIYGSDAVTGVVNIIPRKDYDGVEVTGRYTTQHGTQSYGGSLTFGKVWDRLYGTNLGEGNVVVTYDYSHSDPMLYSASKYLRQDLSGITVNVNGTVYHGLNGTDPTAGAGTPFPGPSGYLNWVPYQNGPSTYYAVPNGTNAALTSADFTANTWNTVARDNYADYLPKMSSHQVSGFINQQLTPWLSVYYQGFYTHRESVSRLYSNGQPSIIFSDLSPYYPTGGIPGVSAFNTAYTANAGMYMAHSPVTLYYNTYKDIGALTAETPDDNATNTIGFKAKLPGDWNADLYFTNSIDHTCGICNFGNNLDIQALQYAVDMGLINPLSNEPLTADQMKLVYGTNLQYGRNVMDDARIKFDGPLAHIPGGDIRVAFGAEYVYTAEAIVNGANRSHGPDVGGVPTYNEESDYALVRPIPSYNVYAVDNQAMVIRRIISGFGEIYVPLVGEANALPFVKSFSVDLAVRYDHYSDFGDTSNPKLGVTWEIDDQLKMRGSIGTSFQAPALTQANPYVYSSRFIIPGFYNATGDSNIASTCYSPTYCVSNVFVIMGSPDELKPQKSNNWSIGFDYAPDWFDGFKMGVTYYDIRYKDQIGAPNWVGAFTGGPELYNIWKPYIHAVNQPSGCTEGDRSTYDPTVLPYIDAVAIYGSIAGQVCSIQAVIDARNTNLATVQYDGIDFHTSYFYNTDNLGTFFFSGSLSVTLHNNQMPIEGAEITNNLGTIYNPVRFRGRANLGWADGPWGANVFMNYVGSYKNNATPTVNNVQIPNYWVPAWITFDVGLNYSFQDEMWSGFKGTRLSVNATNVFNLPPPVVLTSTTAMDPLNANPYGRIISLQLTKAF